MKKNRSTKAESKPRGWIYGAKWAGQPVEARACVVTIGLAPSPKWWCYSLVGQERKAIEVKAADRVLYIDNEDDWALRVFLRGLAPLPKFRNMPAFSVADDEDSAQFYKAGLA